MEHEDGRDPYEEFQRAFGNRLPASLIKACWDPFDYALKLRTGEFIRFHFARISGPEAEFAYLEPPAWMPHNDFREFIGIPAPRGVDVRISDIVWCVDAPEGS